GLLLHADESDLELQSLPANLRLAVPGFDFVGEPRRMMLYLPWFGGRRRHRMRGCSGCEDGNKRKQKSRGHGASSTAARCCLQDNVSRRHPLPAFIAAMSWAEVLVRISSKWPFSSLK